MLGRKWLVGLALLVLGLASGCRLCDRYCEREWDDRYGRGRYYGHPNNCCQPQPCQPGGYSYYPQGGSSFAPPYGYNDCCR